MQGEQVVHIHHGIDRIELVAPADPAEQRLGGDAVSSRVAAKGLIRCAAAPDARDLAPFPALQRCPDLGQDLRVQIGPEGRVRRLDICLKADEPQPDVRIGVKELRIDRTS